MTNLESTFVTGAVTVGVTPVQIFPDHGHVLNQGVQLIAAPANTGIIYIGDTTDGYPLVAQDSIFLRIRDVQSITAIADTPDQRLHYLYL